MRLGEMARAVHAREAREVKVSSRIMTCVFVGSSGFEAPPWGDIVPESTCSAWANYRKLRDSRRSCLAVVTRTSAQGGTVGSALKVPTLVGG